MAKVPPVSPPDYSPPGTRGGAPLPSPGSVPFAPGGSLGGGGSIVVPLLGGAIGVLVGMHPAAWGSHTPATQALFRAAGRKGGKRSAARRAKRRTGKVRVRRVSARTNRTLGSGFRGGRKRKAKLVKGSAAAKRHMAKLRRMRKR